ncbi:unnamed protein product [Effrenium voratum]|nr:unnamed protein product [Effrenium voratum]CAJ1400629.1 unnamed protein product [Effrenium voratum]CAJ1436412.1 unnamed protein product [Effrenium voratum]CAJ1442267.1 unnamed protein product [Effrenium voratum]
MMAHHLQATSARSAVESISKFMSLPQLVAEINADAAELLSFVESERLSRMLRTSWNQITRLFVDVDYIYFADSDGAFVGYEHLPQRFVEDTNAPTRFGGEFRPSDAMGASSQCPLCPPPQALQAGKKTYYFVDERGKYVQTYKISDYDPRTRPWYEKAAAAKGKVVWMDIYNHSSGHTLGMTAAKAVMRGNEVSAIAGADFTVSYLSKFMDFVTGTAFEESFIVDSEGLMIAACSGIQQVAKRVAVFDDGLVRRPWTQLPYGAVQSPMRTLLNSYGSLDDIPLNGTMMSDDGMYLFTFMQGLASFQARQRWILVVSCPVGTYMKESWIQQAWAAQQSAAVQQQLQVELSQQVLKTIVTCAAFTLLGACIMTWVGIAVTRPLKKISMDMLSMAKLEFLPQSYSRTNSMRDFGDRRSTTSFGRFLSALVGRDQDSGGSSSSEMDGDHSDPESDIEGSIGCSATPKEIVNIRESFVFMVAGLKSFARYMDPEIMRILIQSKRQAQLGMGKADVTVFFSDIANFTTIAESLEPEVFLSMLSEYLDEMSKIIMSERGVVGEFIGDAIMAWWNVPIDLGQEHTAIALHAALSQQHRMRELRDSWEERGLPDVRVRMGLVRGTVLAGNLGSSQRMKYGLVGDSVNLASRLEGLCKYYGVSIIIEEEASRAHGVRTKFHLRLLDLVTVKGRTAATELYELVAEKSTDGAEAEAEASEVLFFVLGFHECHSLFRAQHFAACAERLRRYRQTFPEDVPSKLLLHRVDLLLSKGTPPGWTPVHVLTEK